MMTKPSTRFTVMCIAATLAIGSATASFAQTTTTASLQKAQSTGSSDLMQRVLKLQQGWARAIYKMSNKAAKLRALRKLESQAAKLNASYAGRAEPKVWQAIILATDAGLSGGFGALSKVKKAKALLLRSLKINPRALKGSGLTSLGSLYYQVPSWPIAFGSNEKAEKYLKRALQINPRGIDPNYFYGDFLLKAGRKREAKKYLKRAMQAAPRPQRSLADAGRRRQIRTKLKKLRR